MTDRNGKELKEGDLVFVYSVKKPTTKHNGVGQILKEETTKDGYTFIFVQYGTNVWGKKPRYLQKLTDAEIMLYMLER